MTIVKDFIKAQRNNCALVSSSSSQSTSQAGRRTLALFHSDGLQCSMNIARSIALHIILNFFKLCWIKVKNNKCTIVRYLSTQEERRNL